MTFPNAAKGVKKIWLGELLILVGAVLIAITSIFINKGGEIPAAVTTLTVIGFVVMIVAYIINLIGINTAKADDEGFRYALYFALGGIILTGLSTAFQNNAAVTRWTSIFTTLCEVFVSYYVVTGIINLAEKLGDAATAAAAKTSRLWIIIGFCAGEALAQLIVSLAKRQPNSGIIVACGLISLVVQVIVYIIYLRALNKGNNMLNK